MSKSRVRLRDARAAYRLIGECCELGADPVVWRWHMLAGLRSLLGAYNAITTESTWDQSGHLIEPVDRSRCFHVGPEKSEVLKKFLERREELRDPSWVAQGRLNGRLVTRRRVELVEDKTWYSSISFNEYRRPGGHDDLVRSVSRISRDGTVSIISLNRAIEDGLFSPRDAAILHLFHHELTPYLGTRLANPNKPSTTCLSPRLRETLQALLEGESEKQVAWRLRLSQQTVHEYVTKLYRHFGVHSRSELLAFCLGPDRAMVDRIVERDGYLRREPPSSDRQGPKPRSSS